MLNLALAHAQAWNDQQSTTLAIRQQRQLEVVAELGQQSTTLAIRQQIQLEVVAELGQQSTTLAIRHHRCEDERLGS